MKHVLLILLVVAVQLSISTRVRRQSLFGDFDLKKVPQVLQNRAAVEAYVRCLLATDQDSLTVCDKLGKRLRAIVPVAIKNAKCPEPCNDEEKKTVAQGIQILREKYPELFAKLLEHYSITPEQIKQLDDWLASIPSK